MIKLGTVGSIVGSISVHGKECERDYGNERYCMRYVKAWLEYSTGACRSMVESRVPVPLPSGWLCCCGPIHMVHHTDLHHGSSII